MAQFQCTRCYDIVASRDLLNKMLEGRGHTWRCHCGAVSVAFIGGGFRVDNGEGRVHIMEGPGEFPLTPEPSEEYRYYD